MTKRMSDKLNANIVEIRARFSDGIFLIQDLEILLSIVDELEVLPERLQEAGWRMDACEVVNKKIEEIIKGDLAYG